MPEAWYWQNESLFLRLHIQANAKKSEWVGIYGDRLKLKLHAPAIDGKANRALIRFLAEFFDISKSQIYLASGELSQDKLVKIDSKIVKEKLSLLSI
jgi:uncharacterized protein (TIGR00251 family)